MKYIIQLEVESSSRKIGNCFKNKDFNSLIVNKMEGKRESDLTLLYSDDSEETISMDVISYSILKSIK
ncbi:MAG: hypothetical protein EKK61_05715 [Rickettsiales bacterium]|nr:MAG: hypothetical protein EKK61_05715 [Rickettsiales bacterium]